MGLWGGVLLKPLKLRQGGWHEGENLKPGTVVPGDVTSEWPLQNRLAMSNTGYIRYFQTAEEAEGMGAVYAEQARTMPVKATIDAAQAVDPTLTGLAKARAVKALLKAAREAAAAEAANAADEADEEE